MFGRPEENDSGSHFLISAIVERGGRIDWAPSEPSWGDFRISNSVKGRKHFHESSKWKHANVCSELIHNKLERVATNHNGTRSSSWCWKVMWAKAGLQIGEAVATLGHHQRIQTPPERMEKGSCLKPWKADATQCCQNRSRGTSSIHAYSEISPINKTPHQAWIQASDSK